MTLTKTEDKGI